MPAIEIISDELPILRSTIPTIFHFLTLLLFIITLGWLLEPLELYEAVQIAAKTFSLGELFSCLLLDTFLASSDVVEPRECAVDVGVDVFPWFDVESWVHLGDFTDDDQVLELSDLFVGFVGIVLEAGGRFEADWAHVVVPAVIYVGLLLILETLLQLFEGSF